MTLPSQKLATGLLAGIGQFAVLVTVVPAAADILNGTKNNDVLLGSSADDTLNGRGGNDILCGEEGDDDLNGGTGNDTIGGGAGTDHVKGGGGDDFISGGNGGSGAQACDDLATPDPGFIETLEGQGGNDVIVGGGGRQNIFGGAGDDDISANVGVHSADSDGSADFVNCGSGIDIVFMDINDTASANCESVITT